jgi:hypothetical protein
MEKDPARAEAARRAKELGLADLRPDWRGCDAVWDVLEEMATEGATVVIKIDGQRNGPDDNGRYTVLVSGGPLGEDFFRRDSQVLEDGLAEAIVYYAEKCWKGR